MMDRIESGREQLEAAMQNFSGMVEDNLDLSVFMSEEQQHRVKSAWAYKDRLIEMMEDGGEKGVASPWKTTDGRFSFRESEITIWSGYKGHGKSLAISQVFEKFISDGQKVFIISPEFPAHRVLYRMLVQSFSEHNATPSLAIKWLDAVKEKLFIYDQQSSLKPQDIPALCRYAIEKLGVDHVLIDSLMKCGIAPDDYGRQKHLVDSVQQVAHNSKVHIHLVAHARKGSSDEKIGGLHDVKGASEIADMAENVIIVWRNKAKETAGAKDGEPDCVIKIEAQRNGSGWIGIIPLFFNRENTTFYEGRF